MNRIGKGLGSLILLAVLCLFIVWLARLGGGDERDSDPVTYRAPVVIAADGVSARLAKTAVAASTAD